MCSIKLSDIVCQFFVDKLIVDRDNEMIFCASDEISFSNIHEAKSWNLKKKIHMMQDRRRYRDDIFTICKNYDFSLISDA